MKEFPKYRREFERNPVEKVKDSQKAYNRKKFKNFEEEEDMKFFEVEIGFCLCCKKEKNVYPYGICEDCKKDKDLEDMLDKAEKENDCDD